MFDFVFKATPGCFFTPGRVSIGQGELAVAGSGVADLKGLIAVCCHPAFQLAESGIIKSLFKNIGGVKILLAETAVSKA